MARAVLIADRNKGRAKGIAKACMAAKHPVYFAKDGAAALEVAIAKVPGLVIADAELPLIDARKLAEILRTNPRTQGVRFFFLGQLESEGKTLDLFDEVLDDPIDAEQVAARASELFAKQDQLDALEEHLSDERDFKGKLSQIALVDLLQSFHLNRKSGVLALSRPASAREQESGRIVLRGGDILSAAVGEARHEKALFRLLAWEEGNFCFEPDGVDEEQASILSPTRTLLMEGVRQLDEWKTYRNELPAPDCKVAISVRQADLPHMVHPLTQEVLVSLELYERVDEIVDHCSFPDYQVLRTLQTLEGRQIVSIEVPPEPALFTPPAEEGAELFSPPQARRLRGWLESRHPRSSSALDAKLVVVGSGAAAVNGFVGALRVLKGCEVASSLPGAGEFSAGLQDIARVPVGKDASLVFVNLPAKNAYAPLWSAAAFGGLGVLLLLEGELNEVATALRPVVDVLRELPRTRLFFLRLGEADTEAQRAALLAALALGDEDPAFFFLPSTGEEAREVLGGLLGRVLP